MTRTQYVCVWHADGIHGQNCPDFKNPRPPEGKPVTAIESVLFMLREKGMQELYLQEIEKRHTLFPKLVAALDVEHKCAIEGWRIHIVDDPDCKVCALLREAAK